jgi:hypothetical protein
MLFDGMHGDDPRFVTRIDRVSVPGNGDGWGARMISATLELKLERIRLSSDGARLPFDVFSSGVTLTFDLTRD